MKFLCRACGVCVVATSYAPSGLTNVPLAPTACAAGCNLSPLRGWSSSAASSHVKLLSLGDGEVGGLAFGGAGAYPDGRGGRLDYVLHVEVVEGEFVAAQGKFDVLGFSGG